MSDCLYFLRYWAICVLQLLVNQAVTPQNLKLTLSFLLSRFAKWPKSQDAYLNISRTKRAFNVKQKEFFIILKGFQLPKIVSDLRVTLSINSLPESKKIHQILIFLGINPYNENNNIQKQSFGSVL